MKIEILYQDRDIVVINKPKGCSPSQDVVLINKIVQPPNPMGLGCPIVGVSLYRSGNKGEQMMLHAGFLQFIHHETAITLKFYSKPPF